VLDSQQGEKFSRDLDAHYRHSDVQNFKFAKVAARVALQNLLEIYQDICYRLRMNFLSCGNFRKVEFWCLKEIYIATLLMSDLEALHSILSSDKLAEYLRAVTAAADMMLDLKK